MVQQLKIYLFGDQTYDIHSKLRELLRYDQNPVLNCFFERVDSALRTEISKLPLNIREGLPQFSGVPDLLSWNRYDERLAVPFEMALTCIYQLGAFIKDHNDVDIPYPSPNDACILGLCTGNLVAAAVSCCRSIQELLPVSIQTVLVAFRTGICVLDVGRRIEPTAESHSSWSTVVGGCSTNEVEEALSSYQKQNSCSRISQPYISAYALNSFSISGPPSVLGKVIASESFSRFRPKSISIQAPYHAPHLFFEEDIAEILATTSAEVWARQNDTIQVIPSGTAKALDAFDYRSLLKSALEGILLSPIRWEEIIKNLSGFVKGSPFKVLPYGSGAAHTIYSALSQESPAGPATSVPFENSPASVLAEESDLGHGKKSKIAIIGMSGRYPDAQDNEAFWQILEQGLDVHKEVPPLHWDAKTHVDPTGQKKNTSATPFGCWLNNPAAFDARFFFMSPREAPQVDPAQRIALMTAYEAIEQAGIVPDATPSTRKDRVGIFYGVTSNDWMETNSAQDIDTYFIPGGNRAFIPGRLNYFFKFSGPSFSVDTACSSSLAAINIACNSLWNRDIDMAIAGGTNVLTNPDFTAGLDRGHFLSRTGNCRTFDDGADGYCRGEGVGSVILKRLEDALADNDPIQGVILGAHTNHSADAPSITRPHAGAQAAIFGKILSETGVDPYSISYVEMHGTGTQAGDAGEMQSVLNTFAPVNSRRRRRKDEILYLGAAKANVGHGEAAAGVTSLAKLLLMMRNDTIPPHCGIKTKINHKFPTDLDQRNVRIAQQPVSWKRANVKSQTRRAFLNNFSAAGGNTALLLEDAPIRPMGHNEEDSRSCHVIAISAKCPASLQGNLKSMLKFLDQQEGVSIEQLSYTTTARRIHHQHRVMVSGSTRNEIQNQIDIAINNQTGMTRAKSAPKILFTFTGQGSQFPGMGKQLLSSFSEFRSDIHRLDRLGRSHGFASILPIFEANTGSDEISAFSPLVVQLSSVCMQIALSRLWKSWGIVPDAVVGHSLGEYAALNVAGVLSDSDTVYLVGRRAMLLQEMCTRDTHSMLVVRASEETIANNLKGKDYEIACINSPTETVLSGGNDEISAFQTILKDNGLKTTLLTIPYAFHSSQVQPILHDFEEIASGVTFNKPSVPVLSPLTQNVVKDVGTFDAVYLSRHCREPVNMLGALEFAYRGDVITNQTFTIEIGPHPAISGMLKSTLGSQMTVLTTIQRGKDAWVLTAGALKSLYCAGADISWAEYHRDFKSSHRVIQLPAYSWDLKDYWMQYVNDWSLRKGDPPLVINNTISLESTTVHTVLSEVPQGDKITLVLESDITRPDLNPLVQGHLVNGVPLCTPSVYADIALTLGKYLLDKYKPAKEERLVDVSNMVISKALIARPSGPQPLQTLAEVDWNTNSAVLRFCTLDNKNLPTVEHASCIIQFVDKSQLDEMATKTKSIKSRMQALRKGIQEETTARFNRVMVYKMIHALAQFHGDYKAIDEVVLNSDTLEVSSKVSFGDVKKGGDFHTHPAFIDGLTQSSGFAMNCNDKADLDVEVFINHGWKSFQIFDEIAAEKQYTTYSQMTEGKDKMWNGDIAVFEGEQIVASFRGIVLQAVPRRVLFYILSVESGQKPKVNVQRPERLPEKNVEAAKIQAVTQPSTVPKKIENAKPSIVNLAMQIISDESGVDVSDLTDGSSFADMGVDSLLSLNIVARFREELGLEIDFESMFIDYPTVIDLKRFLAPDGEEESTDAVAVEAKTTPVETIIAQESDDVLFEDDFAPALQIISEESGVSVSELTDDSVFSDMGIDSLLSLVIVGRFREELGYDIDSDSIFIDFPTVGALKAFITGNSQPKDGYPTPPDSASSVGKEPKYSMSTYDAKVLDRKGVADVQITPLSTSAVSLDMCHAEMVPNPIRPATSVILQGLPQNCQKTLFLFPDGSGSSTSYASLPRIDRDIVVIGLNSPYMKEPIGMSSCTVDELVEGYLTEIRRRQPNGPYDLGGWSAGGMLAYRATQILCDQGEEVLSLTLIDSPVPRGLDRLPTHFYDFCESLSLFGHAGGSKPDWLIPHFNATIDVFHEYYAEPLLEDQCPKVTIIWACDSVMDGPGVPPLPPHPEDTDGMKFLTEKRTDFSGNGWEDLFPGAEVVIERIENAHHFSMMRAPNASRISEFISRSMG